MNTPDSNFVSHGTGFAGTVFSVIAVAVSMLPELDIWFRILASFSAIIAAWVSIYVMISKLRKDK
jgi:hypothetical protein